MFQVVSRWDKDLDIDFEYKADRLEDEIRTSIQRNFKASTGKLAKSFKVQVPGHINKVSITSNLPYAEIHEYGGNIPERFPRRAKVLRFMSSGIAVFAKHARAFSLPAKGYIKEAVDAWFKKYVNVEWKK